MFSLNNGDGCSSVVIFFVRSKILKLGLLFAHFPVGCRSSVDTNYFGCSIL